ncbi:hypothetical protein PR048_015919 [Dryococelus australis]|uniref:Uncharacterized protein n=1 Tax=Dryococelus australis TaxID=614101 RepID=A0ABQ9HII0_9NEOP|nr:hypothetical protein PR048_015919 [Dryococelus australis]
MIFATLASRYLKATFISKAHFAYCITLEVKLVIGVAISKSPTRQNFHKSPDQTKETEEVVQLIGKRVFNEVISRIKQSKYYSISLGSTPDDHIDQLTFILRYLRNTFSLKYL